MDIYIRQRIETIRLQNELRFYKEQEDILLKMIVEMAPAVMFVEGIKNVGKKMNEPQKRSDYGSQ